MLISKIRNIEDLFQLSLKLIINVLIIFIIVILILGLCRTLYSINDLFPINKFANGFNHIIVDILSFLVILELFKSFIEFFKSRRFRLHSMMDPFIIFVVRELMVILYTPEKIVWQDLVGFSVLIMSLGIIRTLAVVYTPESEKGK
jgi:uncharacterized membrane protein (DUF373 family)